MSSSKSLLFLLLLILTIIPLFGSLDKMPIRLWDESRVATNAFEMSKSNNWIVTTFEGNPDLWNTKPPLLIWIQSIFIKFFGLNYFSIRLPIALASLFTVLFIFNTLGKFSKDYFFGFMASLVLLSTGGYIIEHVARTGDYDALLILFTTISSLSFFVFLETEKTKFLYLFFITLSLAVLTKGVAGLLFTPALFIYLICRKQFIFILKQRTFYYGLILFVLPIISYYCLREYFNPGYFEAVRKNELGGRFLETLENHNLPFDFYFELIKTTHFGYWLVLFFIGIVFGFINKSIFIKRITLFLTLCIGVFFLIISYAQTKLLWYDAPLYPFMAIIVAIPLVEIYKKIQQNAKLKWMSYLFVIVIFAIPYMATISYVTQNKGGDYGTKTYNLAVFIKDMIDAKKVQSKPMKIVLDDEYQPHVWLHIFMAQEKGFKIQGIKEKEALVGDIILVDSDNIASLIASKFDIEIIEQYHNVRKIKLLQAQH